MAAARTTSASALRVFRGEDTLKKLHAAATRQLGREPVRRKEQLNALVAICCVAGERFTSFAPPCYGATLQLGTGGTLTLRPLMFSMSATARRPRPPRQGLPANLASAKVWRMLPAFDLCQHDLPPRVAGPEPEAYALGTALGDAPPGPHLRRRVAALVAEHWADIQVRARPVVGAAHA
jgi:hypothetical protein